ncbi:response regulator [Actomonas aquatica]|uniref:histidine kinase n=1 Tax=Actomonas aquatica TaxID=2866162 RepID=A0ABZ1CC63_9BACT|nr:response regulator [Opitutus sp. WL0086]WRQ89262.1 response regulator [Opitutus sp. WL0086]
MGFTRGGLVLGVLAVWLSAQLSGRQRRAEDEAQRAQADLALATEQTRRLTIVAKNIHNAVVITNSQGELEWCNEGFTRLTGWRIEEVMGRRPGTFLQGPESEARAIQIMHEAQRQRQPFTIEMINYHRDGHAYWVFIEAQPLFDREDQFTGYMAIESDITERKRTALQLAQQEAQLRFVFESSPVGMSWVRHDNLNAQIVNPAYQRITGLRAERARRPGALLEVMLPEERAEVEVLDERLTAGEINHYELERRLLQPDGKVVWVEYSRRRYVEAQSAAWQEVVTLVDITALKSRTADLEAAKELAEEANRAKSQFLAMMSHEIRTPMNGVIGMASVLMESDLTPRQEEFVRTIANSGSDLVSIINDILDFSKIESGHLEVERTAFDLVTCVEESIELLALRAAEKKLELLLDLAPDVPKRLVGDALRLRQVLVNLLGNAVKFTERGEVMLKVTRRALPSGRNEVRFEVSDTGIGIEPRKIPRLFDAFTQDDASTTRRYGGTGLGLPICKRLVELMGGSMWWESAPGEGTLFGFSLRMQAGAGRAPEPLPSSLRGRSLLVVDDNASSRRLLGELAERAGMRVTLCAERDDALEAMSTGQRFDLAMVDHDLAGSEGTKVLEQLHRIWRDQAPAVAVLAPKTFRLQPAHRRLAQLVIKKPLCQGATLRAWAELLARPTTKVEPAKPVSSAVKAPASDSAAAKAPGQIHVLVAEDNLVNQELVSLMLSSLGYACSCVNDGAEVVSRLQAKHHDVVLMDVQMPGLDGFEATQRVREELPAERQPWVIAVTANAMAGDRERCLSAGMNDYVSKPLKLGDLAAVMERARTGTARERV